MVALPAEPGREVGEQRSPAELRLHPGHGLGGLDVAEVGEEPRLPSGRDEERRVRALETGEVEDVREGVEIMNAPSFLLDAVGAGLSLVF